MAVTAGRRIGKLTARFVETTKTAGLHGDGGGLYLKVGDSGAKSWIVRWSSAGNVHKLGLGATHTVSLVRARERAADVRRLILDGIDPREARRTAAIAEAKSISFDDACERYIASHSAGWKTAKHVRQWQTTLQTYASPMLGKLPVSAIDIGMVMRVLATALDGAERHGVPPARSHRSRVGMEQGARLSQRREPGGVAQQSRSPAAETDQGAQDRASRGDALQRVAGLPARAAPASGDLGAGAGACDS